MTVDGYDVHSVGFGDKWNEVVVTEATDVSEDRIVIKTVLLNPITYREQFDQLKLDIVTILNESAARGREGRPNPDAPETVSRVITGADYQAAVAKALEQLSHPDVQDDYEQLELDL